MHFLNYFDSPSIQKDKKWTLNFHSSESADSSSAFNVLQPITGTFIGFSLLSSTLWCLQAETEVSALPSASLYEDQCSSSPQLYHSSVHNTKEIPEPIHDLTNTWLYLPQVPSTSPEPNTLSCPLQSKHTNCGMKHFNAELPASINYVLIKYTFKQVLK